MSNRKKQQPQPSGVFMPQDVPIQMVGNWAYWESGGGLVLGFGHSGHYHALHGMQSIDDAVAYCQGLNAYIADLVRKRATQQQEPPKN